jgi:DnaA family protein
MSAQLSLNIRLGDRFSFDNYIAGPNTEAVHQLHRAATEGGAQTLYLWGAAGSGKSHLLQAACRARQVLGGHAVYVPLGRHQELHPDMLQGLDAADLVCLDDVDAIAGRRDWETAILGLYERCRGQTSLVWAAGTAPAALPMQLSDLRTRCGAGLVYALQLPDEATQLAALQLRARERGFELSDDVGHYVLTRYPRDMHALFTLLDRLDDASLSHQRRLTVPFLRSLESRSG